MKQKHDTIGAPPTQDQQVRQDGGAANGAAAGAPAATGAAVPQDVAGQWDAIQARLRASMGEARFSSWFANIRLIGIGDGAVSYAVPTSFARDYIRREFGDMLLALWQQQEASIRKVTLFAEATAGSARAACGGGARTATVANAAGAPNTQPQHVNPNSYAAPRAAVDNPFAVASHTSTGPHLAQAGNMQIGAPILPQFTFDNFIVGASNRLACAAARRVAESDTMVHFNPLYLYGPVGLGKTHLLHAIASEILRRDPSKRVVYLSAERFMYHFVNALRHKDMAAFKQAYRSADVLIVDDVHFIGGKGSTQEEFFHTFNALMDHNRQIIISADRAPSDLQGIDERIRSRLSHGLACDILPTDHALRLGVLRAKAAAMQANHPGVVLSDDVLDFLARAITSSIRELEGALTTLVAHAELTGLHLTLERAETILHDLVRIKEKRIAIDDIQRKVTEYYGLRMVDMASQRRSRSVARPRQVAMYLCKQLTTRSLPEIGRKFGNRDHTTVLHGVKRIEELRAGDKALDDAINSIRAALDS